MDRSTRILVVIGVAAAALALVVVNIDPLGKRPRAEAPEQSERLETFPNGNIVVDEGTNPQRYRLVRQPELAEGATLAFGEVVRESDGAAFGIVASANWTPPVGRESLCLRTIVRRHNNRPLGTQMLYTPTPCPPLGSSSH